MVKLELKSLDNLGQIAKKICETLDLKKPLNRINCLAFYGEMGAGKTTLIKAVCNELGIVENVTSPTFSLVNEYATINNDIIYHFDFYRLNKTAEAFDLGYEEYFYSGKLCLIEWPEKIEQLLPESHTRINIVVKDSEMREIEIHTTY
jgi:tRNA threonylcarbamoyladenosine biosynthesis protein TsaE